MQQTSIGMFQGFFTKLLPIFNPFFPVLPQQKSEGAEEINGYALGCKCIFNHFDLIFDIMSSFGSVFTFMWGQHKMTTLFETLTSGNIKNNDNESWFMNLFKLNEGSFEVIYNKIYRHFYLSSGYAFKMRLCLHNIVHAHNYLRSKKVKTRNFLIT